MSTAAEIQKQLARNRIAAENAARAKAAADKVRAAATAAAAAAETARQRRVYGQAAEADFEKWQASPKGLASLAAQRAANPTRGVRGNARDEARERADDLAVIERNRKAFVQARIAREVAKEGKPVASSTREEVSRGNRAQGGQGAAAKPVPKTVIEDRLKGEGVNTNIKQEVVTSNSAFSLGQRTKGAFNIGRFRAEVSGADSILPTHSFLVVFAPMPWAIQKYPSAGNLDSLLTMRCDNVVLPSINLLQEQNIRRYGFGPVENVAYGVNVGDFTLQFIVDKKAEVVSFFEAWLNQIVKRDSYGGADMNSTDSTGRTPYEIAYKDAYACSSVNVFVYDRSQNNVMEYNIYDVFPTGIQSMNMSWSEENTLMKLNITFSFTDLRIQQSAAKNKQGAAFSDQIKVSATGQYAVNPFASGNTFGTFDSTGARGLELTDLSNDTVIIGNGFSRVRGSVTPPIESTTLANAITPQVRAPTTRLPSGIIDIDAP